MIFTDDELARALGKIVCMTLRPQSGVSEVVKGRVDNYDHESVSLVGDSAVRNPLEGPDPDENEPGTKVVRLGPSDARTIRFIEVKDTRWSHR